MNRKTHISQFKKYNLRKKENLFNPFVGSDGGQINGQICIIGLEWGGREKEIFSATYKYQMHSEINGFIPFRDPECSIPIDWQKSKFDKLLSIFTYYLLNDKMNFEIFKNTILSNYITYNLYNTNCNFIKFNLFPLPCPQFHIWPNKTKRKNSLYKNWKRKYDYKKEMINNRFPLLKEVIFKLNQKNIICIGNGKDAKLYYETLFFENSKYLQKPREITISNKKVFFYNYAGKDIYLIPFLGYRNGWKDLSLSEFATEFKKILIP